MCLYLLKIFFKTNIKALGVFRTVETLFATNVIFIIELNYQRICVAPIHRPESSVHFISIYPVEAYSSKGAFITKD